MNEWDLTFYIGHRPRPYTRTTQKQKYTDPRWTRYTHSRDHIRADFLEQVQGHEKWGAGDHLSVHIVISTGVSNYNNIDLDNELKGILDALQGYAFTNDAWIDEIYIIRHMSPEGYDMATVQIKKRHKSWFAIKALKIPGRYIRQWGLMQSITVAMRGVIRHVKNKN